MFVVHYNYIIIVIFLVKNILKSTDASSGTFIVIRVSLARLVSLILPRRRTCIQSPPLEKILYATLMLLYVIIIIIPVVFIKFLHVHTHDSNCMWKPLCLQLV